MLRLVLTIRYKLNTLALRINPTTSQLFFTLSFSIVVARGKSTPTSHSNTSSTKPKPRTSPTRSSYLRRLNTMTSLPRVLAIGITHAPPRSAIQRNRQQSSSMKGFKGLRGKIDAQVSQAKEIGFDLEFVQMKPSKIDAQVAQLRKKLTDQKPELLIIGFGIRGSVEYTELFESLLHVCREASPGTRVAFNTSMEGTIDVCKRHVGAQSQD